MILIIDDDSAVRSSLSFMLKRAGYEVKRSEEHTSELQSH